MPSPPPPSVHHIHPLPLSKISSALVYYYTCPTRHSTLLLSTTTPLLLPCRQQQRGPIKLRQNYCYPLLPLPLVDYQYINDNINRHNSTLLCHSVSVCYHHWSNVKQDSCRVKMTSFTIAWKTAITISHFSYPLHILTVTPTTIHQRISHFIRYLYFTAKKKHTLHTLNVERISNEWRAPFVLLAINLRWDWGSRRNKPCAPGFNVTSTSHMKIMKSRYTAPLFHTAPTRCCVGLRGE